MQAHFLPLVDHPFRQLVDKAHFYNSLDGTNFKKYKGIVVANSWSPSV